MILRDPLKVRIVSLHYGQGTLLADRDIDRLLEMIKV